MLSRCKSVHKMATGKKWRSTHAAWQQVGTGNKLQVEIGTKMKLEPRWNWDQKWKIKIWPWMRGENAWRGHQWQHVHNCPWLRSDTPRCEHQWRHDHFHWFPHFFLCVSTSHLAHTHRGSSNESFTPSTCPCSCERFSSPLLSPSTSRTSCRTFFHFLLHLKFVDYNLLRTPHKESMACLTSSSSPQFMSPTPTTSRRPQSSPTRSSWTRRRSSPTKSLLRTPTTMTLHSRVCFAKLTEYIAITLHEKTCLSVCRRRQCPIERGDPLSKETRKHRLGHSSTNKKSKFLQSAKQELINTNFKQLEPRKFNNEINSFFKDNYCSKIWNYVKLIREVSLKWKS